SCPGFLSCSFSAPEQGKEKVFSPSTDSVREQICKAYRPYGGFRIEAAAPPMSIWCWNCQGAGSTETVQKIREVRRLHFPDFMFLMETKQKYAYVSGLQKSLGYDKLFTVEPNGLSGGLAVMWKDSYNVEILSSDKRIIDMKISSGPLDFFLSCIYGDP
uniref:Endonuclease/exonuclease/phosphatase domain-containing protein n=2 Tax=Brassica oleracea TaxID=3712 RepID=A0A0D2ZZG0_BRAOL